MPQLKLQVLTLNAHNQTIQQRENRRCKTFGCRWRQDEQTGLNTANRAKLDASDSCITINPHNALYKANANEWAVWMDRYGADSLGVVALSFCDVAVADSSSTPLPASGIAAASESGLASSACGMSWVASDDAGSDWSCSGRSGSFSMFANSNSYSNDNHFQLCSPNIYLLTVYIYQKKNFYFTSTWKK